VGWMFGSCMAQLCSSWLCCLLYCLVAYGCWWLLLVFAMQCGFWLVALRVGGHALSLLSCVQDAALQVCACSCCLSFTNVLCCAQLRDAGMHMLTGVHAAWQTCLRCVHCCCTTSNANQLEYRCTHA
jgi:hypothetical protein